ncbi:ClbS/DfsB family four-helix bundle protein [bacterium SCSIO 12741]|nr:ClbS/DfsB family four-helix bundle protein [bacterium SCSIO 12741]
MPRPKSKDELLHLSQANFNRLNQLIDSYSSEEQLTDFPPGTMNRNIRDVLAHLDHWHGMMKGWYKCGMSGKKPVMPAAGYTWKTVPKLNRAIWETYKNDSLEAVRKRFEASYLEMVNLIESHSSEELFEKKRYAWTGSTSLGAYLISATSSHYDWAWKLIRKAKK